MNTAPPVPAPRPACPPRCTRPSDGALPGLRMPPQGRRPAASVRVAAAIVVLAAAAAQPGGAHAADPVLGRLFFTPEERRRIDAGPPPRERVPERPRDADRGARPSAAPLRVDGAMRRVDGGAAVWVDGRPFDPHAGDGLRVGVGADPSRVRVARPGERPAELRAGESEERPGLGPGNRVEVLR